MGVDTGTAETTPLVVTVAASSVSGTGPGTVITPEGHPNIIVKVIQPVTVITVRALRVFLQTLTGLVTAGLAAPKALPASDFLHLVMLSAGLSLAPVFFCIAQNSIELLGKWDQRRRWY